MKVKAWLIEGGQWSEIDDPVAVDDDTSTDAALKEAGYAHAVTLGPPDDLIGAEVRAEVWAGSHATQAEGDVAGSPYPYLCLIDLGMERVEWVYCATLPALLGLCAQIVPLVRLKPLALRDAGRYAVNMERLTFVERGRRSALLHFAGGGEPLALTGGDADEFVGQLVEMQNEHSL